MKVSKLIGVILLVLLSHLSAVAQDITVSVMPVQQVLPPQVSLYVNNPGKYFNITLTNNGPATQNVYLALHIEQITPQSGLSVTTPARRLPQTPFIVPAGGSRQLTLVEMKTMFNHLPKNEIQTTPGLFDNYENGSFGLLPEGLYQAQITAYKWDPGLPSPVAVSNPNSGKCSFTVCYKAQAPQFLTPMVLSGSGLDGLEVAKVNPMVAQFTWRTPVLVCNPMAAHYNYRFKVVEVYSWQQPDEAMEMNPIVYQKDQLTTPMVMIPSNIISNKFSDKKTYAAQVTAISSTTNILDYVSIENEGKSALRLFKLDDGSEPKVVTPDKPKEEETEPSGDDIVVISGGGQEGEKINDSLYNFRNPVIVEPQFYNDGVRKLFTPTDIPVRFRPVQFYKGEGDRQDTLKWDYTIQLFNADPNAELKDIIKGKPIWSVKNPKNNQDTVKWEKIKDKVKKGDYLVVYVKPECKNEKSVTLTGDGNSKDFALTERLHGRYFQCANQVEIGNTEPTTTKLSELRGQRVSIGEYEMVLDKLTNNSDGSLSGTGHVEWNPMGFKVMLAVKFDSLRINSDMQVYEGTAITYPDEAERKKSNVDVVEKLFSDWGIDDLIGDSELPCADRLSGEAKNQAKNLAEKIDISTYYNWVSKGQSVWNQFLKGEISDLHLPVGLPNSYNKSPLKVQIVNMKFAPTYATMDVFGQFELPNSKYTDNKVLLFGAPRLCVSPNRVLPEGGTMALLADFTVKDPKSDYECKFKCPSDLVEPADGCYIAWSEDALSRLNVDIDMTIPHLKKDKGGKTTDEHPILHIQTSISSWDNWMADHISMDPFQVPEIPGWTFTAQDIVYDHSVVENSNYMGAFPANYDKQKVGISNTDQEWMGLYIGKVAVDFPTAIEVTDKGRTSKDKRLTVSGEKMFFDNSGATLQLQAVNLLAAGTAKVGGWGISVDTLGLRVLQNDFKETYFNGIIKTPLEGDVRYTCNMYAQGKKEGRADNDQGWAYIFKTQQIDQLNFDFWLAKMEFDKKQTYFLVEAETHSDGRADEVKVELSIGGRMSIEIAKKAVEGLASKAGVSNIGAIISTKIPDIHIDGMRLANCKRWHSKYTDNLYELPTASGSNTKPFRNWKAEYNIPDNPDADGNKFFFSLGRWSLSSMSKKLGPFDFNIEDYDFSYKNSKAILSVKGSVGMMEGALSAGCGLALTAKVNTGDWSFKFGGVEFQDVSFHSGFGGVNLDGTLKIVNDAVKGDGYSGELEFTMPGNLFGFKAEGGYFTKKENNDEYPWGYFKVKAQTNIDITPIKITGLTGGFYFNCKPGIAVGIDKNNSQSKADSNPTPKNGVFGGLFGIDLATTAGEHLLNAGLEVLVAYDTKYKNPKTDKTSGRLTRFVMSGKLSALSTSGNSGDGLINSECVISYVHEDEHYLSLDISVTSDGSVDKALDAKIAEFAGTTLAKGKAISAKVSDMMPVDASTKSGDANTGNGPTPDDSSVVIGKADINIQFKVTFDGPTKWHLYVGRPNHRCTFTLIDFKFPKSCPDCSIGIWAYLRANGYLCLGNELPEEGFPDVPKDVREFLDNKKDLNGEVNPKSATFINNRKSKLQTFIELVNDKKSKGGMMLGACAEGGFGCNAGLVFANGKFTVGFDVMLKKFEEGAKCTSGKKMGWHDWYGMGQAYAMLQGEMGVMIDLWFYSGKVSLIEAGLGALLQAGLPSPTWVYGKARARCSLLGGLFQFNHSIELKAGDICLPDNGDPLDNIELFAEVEPGEKADQDKGWAEGKYANSGALEPISPYVEPRFVTNFLMNSKVSLVDENLVQDYLWKNETANDQDARRYNTRTYRFLLNDVEVTTANGSKQKVKAKTDDNVNFTIPVTLSPTTKYKLHLSGYAQELYPNHVFKNIYGWGNPTIDRKQQEKTDAVDYYFRTAGLPDNIDHDIEIAIPGKGAQSRVRLQDVRKPVLSLNHVRNDLVKEGYGGSDKHYYRWRILKNGKVAQTFDNYVWRTNSYEKWGVNEYNGFTSVTAGTGTKYTLQLYRVSKNAGKNEKAKVSHEVTKTNKNYKSSSSSQPSSNATSSMQSEMQQFFDEVAKEDNMTAVREQEYKDELKINNDEEILFQTTFSDVQDKKFEKGWGKPYDIDFIFPYEEVYMAVNANNANRPNQKMIDPQFINSGLYKGLAPTVMSFYANYAVMGCVGFYEYRWAGKENNINQTEGLDITHLQNPTLRANLGTLDGIVLNQSTNPNTYYLSKAFNDIAPLGRTNSDQFVGQTGGNEYTSTRYKLSTGNYKIWNTDLHKDLICAFLSDAYGTHHMTEMIQLDAKTVHERLISILKQMWNQYGKGKNWEQYQKDYDDAEFDYRVKYFNCNSAYGGYKAYTKRADRQTHTVNIPYDDKTYSFNFQYYDFVMPQYHFYMNESCYSEFLMWQLNVRAHTSMQEYDNNDYPWNGWYRGSYDAFRKVADIFKTYVFDADNAIKNSFPSVSYDVYRMDTYRIDLRTKQSMAPAHHIVFGSIPTNLNKATFKK